MRHATAAVLAVAMAMLAGPPHAHAQTPPPSELTQPNPNAHIGKLGNGLRVGTMPMAGTGRLVLILQIDAGSLNEREDERGAAHYLEHMAFNGSQHFPPGDVPRVFEQAGLALGKDQTATTSTTATVYRLEIPEVTDAKLDLALRWMRDVADGLTIDPAQVERERGVILSEYVDGETPARQIGRTTSRFLAPGVTETGRLLVEGTQASIKALDAARLRAFYRRWYRPTNAVVVAVGDEPSDLLQQRIAATFGSWQGDGPAPPAPALGAVDPRRGLDVLTQSDVHSPTLVQVCRVGPYEARSPEGVAVWLRQHELEAWQDVLTQRLEHVAGSATPPFVAAEIDNSELYRTGAPLCINALAKGTDWRAALTAVSDELRRMALFGVTGDDLAQMSARTRIALDATVAAQATATPEVMASSILGNITAGGTFSTGEEDRRVGLIALGRLTRKGVAENFSRRETQASGPLIAVVSPVAVPAADVRAAWIAAQAATAPAAAVATRAAPWPYESFGPPPPPPRREAMYDPDFVRFEFANGLRVNFKRATPGTDSIILRVQFGAGTKEIPAAQIPAALLAGQVLIQGGLGKASVEDIYRHCDGHMCDLNFKVSRERFSLSGVSRPQDLDLELQLAAAYLSDPGFRPELNARIPTTVGLTYRAYVSEPMAVAGLASDNAMARPHASDLPPERQMAALTAADLARVIGPSLRSDPVELTIIGDFTEPQLIASVSRTLGALPARPAVDRSLPDAPLVRFPDPIPPVVRVTHEGAADQAVVMARWPLFAWTPDRAREGRTLELLAGVVRARLFDTVRQKMGASYSPSAQVDLPRGGDQGSLAVLLQTTPADAEPILAVLRGIVADVAAGGIDPEVFDRARRPVLDDGAKRESNANWWAAVLDGSWAHPDQLAEARSWMSDYAGITLADVKASARTWLSGPPVAVVALPAVAAEARAAP